jgi:mono/diheme cytochrome c family protein
MRSILILTAATLMAAGAIADVMLPGDAAAGIEIFKSQRCVTCHSINGEGGKVGPDLGKRTGRSYTPSVMASLMWNHAPQMWATMEKKGVERPDLTKAQAADLFAFFYSARYFEKPGDAARGRQAFLSKRCANCHSLTATTPGGGPPVKQWNSLADPIALAQQMWDHAATMTSAMTAKHLKWPQISAQELTDILVYLQNLPQMKDLKGQFSPASAETGETLFEAKGCGKCHTGSNSLQSRFPNRTLTDFAAAMWNHEPRMKNSPPTLSGNEMRRIVGYLWSIQFFDTKGTAAAGKKVFTEKKCAGCHLDASSGAPSLAGKQESPFTIVAALWKHGPAMLARMQKRQIAWPRFKDAEMSDLLAYLRTMK